MSLWKVRKKWFDIHLIFCLHSSMVARNILFIYCYCFFFKLYICINFFCMHKKKVLKWRKFLTSDFWWSYTCEVFWTTIWLFLDSFGLSVYDTNFVPVLAHKLMCKILWNFTFTYTSLNKWWCSFTSSKIFGTDR